MTFAMGLTAKLVQNKPNRSEHTHRASLTDDLVFVNSFQLRATYISESLHLSSALMSSAFH